MASHMMEKEEPGQGQYQKVDLEGTGSKVDSEEAHVFPISTATIVFQLLMVLASIYYSMLLTNWGKPSIMDTTYDGFFSNNYMSYWVQMSALWVSQTLYIFSLTAPLCFPNRDFGE